MKLPKLRGKLRRPTTATARKRLAARDFLRRQRLNRLRRAITGCIAYLFKSTTTDSIQLGSLFTGNIKVILAATSTDGIPAQILAGMQGAFTPSIDPLYDPQWMQFEANVTDLASIVDSDFNGVVGGYAKDDVWYSVDMGEPELRWVWTLNGLSFGTNPTMDLNVTSTYKNTFVLSALPVSAVRLFESDDLLSYLSLSSSGVLSITGSITAKIGGVSVVSGVTSITIDDVIALEITPTASMSISNYPASTLLPTIKNYGLVVTGILNTVAFASGTANYEFLEPYSDEHIAVDSDNADILLLSDTALATPASITSGVTWTAITNGYRMEVVDASVSYPNAMFTIPSGIRTTTSMTITSGGTKGLVALAPIGDSAQRINGVANGSVVVSNRIVDVGASTACTFLIDGASLPIGTLVDFLFTEIYQTTKMQTFNVLPADITKEPV